MSGDRAGPQYDPRVLGLLGFLALAVVIAVVLYVGSIVREALSPPRVTTAWAVARGRPSCPADLGLEAREWRLDVGGRGRRASLAVWEVELAPEAAGPTALSVVFVHGWGRSRIDSLARIGPFVDAASRLVLVDLRGHGDAIGRTTLGDGDERDLADLIRRLPDGPVILVGHSLGATVAIRCAALTDAAPRIAGVVAIAPYDTVRSPLRGRLLVRDLPAGPLLSLAVAALRLCGVRAVSTLEAARLLRAPLAVLHGDGDRISPPREGHAIADAGRGTLVVFEGVEHVDHEQRRPELFDDACRRLLTSGVGHAEARHA